MKLVIFTLLGAAVALSSYAALSLTHPISPKTKIGSELNHVFSKPATRFAASKSIDGLAPGSSATPATSIERAAGELCRGHDCTVASADLGDTPADEASFGFDAPTAAGGFASGAAFTPAEISGPDDAQDEIFDFRPSDPTADYFGLPAAATSATRQITSASSAAGESRSVQNNLVSDSSGATGSNGATVVAVSTPVPEPKIFALLSGGFCAVGFMARRRRIR